MGLFSSDRYNTGRSWHLDRKKYNTQEDWEKPMKKRKLRYFDGGRAIELDYDKEMALSNLDMIHDYAVELDKMVSEDSELEEWVKMKMTRIEQNVADVKHALEAIDKYGQGGMIFKKQLLHVAKYATEIKNMVEGGVGLMSWQEEKLAISAEYIDGLYHHLDYKMGNRASQFGYGGEAKYDEGGRTGDTFENILLDFGFTKKRTSYGYRVFYNSEKDIYVQYDLDKRELIANDTQLPFSVRHLIEYLESKGLQGGRVVEQWSRISKKYDEGGDVFKEALWTTLQDTAYSIDSVGNDEYVIYLQQDATIDEVSERLKAIGDFTVGDYVMSHPIEIIGVDADLSTDNKIAMRVKNTTNEYANGGGVGEFDGYDKFIDGDSKGEFVGGVGGFVIVDKNGVPDITYQSDINEFGEEDGMMYGFESVMINNGVKFEYPIMDVSKGESIMMTHELKEPYRSAFVMKWLERNGADNGWGSVDEEKIKKAYQFYHSKEYANGGGVGKKITGQRLQVLYALKKRLVDIYDNLGYYVEAPENIRIIQDRYDDIERGDDWADVEDEFYDKVEEAGLDESFTHEGVVYTKDDLFKDGDLVYNRVYNKMLIYKDGIWKDVKTGKDSISTYNIPTEYILRDFVFEFPDDVTEGVYEEEEYAGGGGVKSHYNTGRSWHSDRAKFNKSEDWEIPMNQRKGKKSKSSRSGYTKADRKRGYSYIPNIMIREADVDNKGKITNIDGANILDGIYVKAGTKYAHGGMIQALKAFNIDDLDQYERFMYDRMSRSMPKEDVLQIIINDTEGDFTQLSPKLADIASEYYKGGGRVKDYKYVPNYMIDSVTVERNGKETEIDGDRILDGLYVKGKVKYAGGGLFSSKRPKSALMRDRAYKSDEPHERAYSRKRKPKNPRYSKYEGGGSFESEPLAHYQVGDAVFIDYMDAADYCDENNIDYSEIMKTYEYAGGGGVRVSNRDARFYVANKTPFRANNLQGDFMNGVYVVRSYGYYPVFIYHEGKWYENSNKYSASTGKQMGQTRPDNTHKISEEEMNYLMNNGELLNPVFTEFDYGGSTMRDESVVRDNCVNGEIHCDTLTEIIGHKPNYPYQQVGMMKLEKCFLRPYYRIC